MTGIVGLCYSIGESAFSIHLQPSVGQVRSHRHPSADLRLNKAHGASARSTLNLWNIS